MVKKNQAGLWVLAFDIHYPLVHKPAFNAMMDFLTKNAVRGFVFGGDQMDNSSISHHNVRRILFREPGAYAKATAGFDKDILIPLEKLIPKDSARIYISGNHDFWEKQLVEENPELEGTIEREILLHLSQRGWDFVPTGKGFNLGKLLVIHGETLNGASYAKKGIENYAQSIAMGHHHSVQSFTKVLPQSQQDKWIGQSFPALCTTNPVYLRNAPNAWVNGFGIVEVDEQGNFNMYPVVVTKGQFRYGGKSYGKRTK